MRYKAVAAVRLIDWWFTVCLSGLPRVSTGVYQLGDAETTPYVSFFGAGELVLRSTSRVFQRGPPQISGATDAPSVPGVTRFPFPKWKQILRGAELFLGASMSNLRSSF